MTESKAATMQVPEPSRINDEIDRKINFKNKISLLRKVNTQKLQSCLTDMIDTYQSLTQVYQRLNEDNKSFNNDNKFSI